MMLSFQTNKLIAFFSKGVKHFDFIPESYIIPEEFNEFNGQYCLEGSVTLDVSCARTFFVNLVDDTHFLITCNYRTLQHFTIKKKTLNIILYTCIIILAAFLKDRRPWIVKPVASSRGRGIYLVNHVSLLRTICIIHMFLLVLKVCMLM